MTRTAERGPCAVGPCAESGNRERGVGSKDIEDELFWGCDFDDHVSGLS